MQLATYFIVLGKRVNKTILKISLYSTTAKAIMLQSDAFYKIENQKTFLEPITSNLLRATMTDYTLLSWYLAVAV